MVKKHIFIKTISFLTAFSLVLIGFLIKERQKISYYHTRLENQYSRSFEQLNSSLNNISLSLEKVLYLSTPKKVSALSTEIFTEAEIAKTALSELPIAQSGNHKLYRFLSQVGNYSISVSKKINKENTITDKQRKELKKLSDTARAASDAIGNSAIEYNNHHEWSKMISAKLNNVINNDSLATSLTELEENMSDYPTLIYDGPYSDHILNKQPLMTSNAKKYTKDMAFNVAKTALDKDTLKFEEESGGKIECYRFSGGGADITVSKKGGYVVYMRKSRTVNESKISYKTALEKAKEYLKKLDYTRLIDTYYFTDNGICVINFAHFDGETICYTDLIKVGVAMDTGEVMLLEASGYLTNHTLRAFAEPIYTEAQARERVSDSLDIIKASIALIPTDSGGEVRCYEFLCKGEDDREILVYINMRTLEEEQIYILLKTDGGTLVK